MVLSVSATFSTISKTFCIFSWSPMMFSNRYFFFSWFFRLRFSSEAAVIQGPLQGHQDFIHLDRFGQVIESPALMASTAFFTVP
jgi:hypothetical protein